MAFKGIVGQERIIELLSKALSDKQTPHAYLFEGAEGLGKRRVACQLAMGIACTGEIKPCHHCTSCLKLIHRNHPEVKYIEDEGSSIKIETIRQLQKEIQMKPYEGKKKIFIINHGEKMTIQAQNALLKTLEEPPSYGTIILITANSSSLLPTIVSRCQVIKFRPVELEKIQDYLIKSLGLTYEEAKIKALFSNGIIGNALKILEDEAFEKKRETLIEITSGLMKGKSINVLENAGLLVADKKDINEFLDLLISWYRDLMVYKETKEYHFMMNYDKIEEINQQSSRIGLNELRDIIFIIEDTKNKLKSNVNLQLNIEVMLLKMQEVL
ncbi:DNA polymerase III subunit delta' [Alkaliphilus peptidifermentans]|uniref:DNA polymerase III subunit delta' n=1 Tax=Alkaliphilus peptidifermentans DSM 18978 TaxID=1120976 RepID=A0A1G5APP9_9FIRM|nr:DNA polymerase III subunit delta' [Alkaliphilus peptidifermentans]SCX79800.1 DNA polymerase III, delta prime subunit [Alkaliphilus peptidifermentans DSM 18978]